MSEIGGTLEQIRVRLNEFISAAHPRPDPWVILSNIMDQNGNPYEAAKDKVVMTLINIQREDTIATYNAAAPVRGESYAILPKALNIVLYVLLYANFSDATYREGLGAISEVISFFQHNPVFNHKTLPGLPCTIDKLTFEITNLDTMELNHLVGMLGANILPSVYYKVRLIPFVSGAMRAEVAGVAKLRNPARTDEPMPPEV